MFGCNLSCEDETVQSDRANGRFEGPRHRAEDPVDSDEIEDGLVELGKHTGLSGRRCLSKIERGQLFPTLATLLRIALAFSVGLDYFIVAERDTPVVGISRHQERMRFPEKAGGTDQAYEFESLDFSAVQRLLNSYFAEFFAVAPEKLRRHQHPGAEFIYVLSGTLHLHIGDEQHTLEARDSIYFDSTVPSRVSQVRRQSVLRARRHDGVRAA